MKLPDGIVVEPLAEHDLVALAQCYALDATVFPHPSIPFLIAGAAPTVWIARGRDDEPPARSGAVIGFAATHTMRHDVELVGLAVDDGWRGRGIGGALVDAVVRAAKRARFAQMMLHVSTTNEAAVRLYEQRGFARVQRLDGYYRSPRFGDDGAAWLMRCNLRARTAARSIR